MRIYLFLGFLFLASSPAFAAPGGVKGPPNKNPTVTNVNPSSAGGNEPISILGSKFGRKQGSVTISGHTAAIVSWNDRNIVALVPTQAVAMSNAPLSVSTQRGLQSNVFSFTVEPVIHSIQPASGSAGDEVTLTGTGFGSVSMPTVFFNQVTSQVTSWGQTEVQAVVPSLGTTQEASVLVVVNGVGSNTAVFSFETTPESDTWIATSQDNAPVGHFRHTAVWTGTEMIVWGGQTGVGATSQFLQSGARYNPATDSWLPTSITPETPEPRWSHTAIWTGEEMIIWGGHMVTSPTDVVFNSGGRYNPTVDSWEETSLVNAPTPRSMHAAVWTGTDMFVWGGTQAREENDLTGGETDTGALYNPTVDSWVPTRLSGAPQSRQRHTMVWTGNKAIVWGGLDTHVLFPSEFLNSGGIYEPQSDTWTSPTLQGAPTARIDHVAVSTGDSMIVWGGSSEPTGGIYFPQSDFWLPTTTSAAPSPRFNATAVWDGTEMILWGGLGFGGPLLGDGAKYSPTTDTWSPVSQANAPSARWGHTGVWTGTEMIIWGGMGENEVKFNSGGRYFP